MRRASEVFALAVLNKSLPIASKHKPTGPWSYIFLFMMIGSFILTFALLLWYFTNNCSMTTASFDSFVPDDNRRIWHLLLCFGCFRS